jgi:hypothetical protein
VDQNIAVNSKNVPYKGDPPIQTVFDFSWLRLRDYHSVGQVYSQEINHISKIVALSRLKSWFADLDFQNNMTEWQETS